MKAQLHKLPLNSNASFFYTTWDCNFFDKPWHFHEEYELVLIERSRGTRFIGDSVSLFEEGDVFLIGPNIPHLFRNSEEYYNNPKLRARSVFIHFSEHFLGNEFFNIPELKSVREFLDSASTALQIKGRTKQRVSKKLHEMKDETPPRRLLAVVEILLKLSESKELETILPTSFTRNKTSKNKDTNRINNVLDFIIANYHKKIYLSQVASMIGMTDAAFSRYFKLHTRKTFTSYLTEVRISQACRLLMWQEESIARVGYLSGFENLANFYRHFKNLTGEIPKKYQRRFFNQNIMPIRNR